MTEASEVQFGLEVTKGVIGKFLMAIIGFVGTVLFARILGPVAFGGFYLLWSIVLIAKLPIDGLSTASKKRYSESDAEKAAILGATLLAVLVIAAVATISAVIVREELTAYTGIAGAPVLFGILFVSTTMFVPLQQMLNATGRVSRTIWIDFLRSVLTTPLQLAFVLLGTGAAGMAYGLSLGTALVIPISYLQLGTNPSIPGRKIIRRLWSFARFSIFAVTVRRIYNRFDVLLLGFLLAPSAAGQYEVALKLTLPAVFLSEVAGEGLMARVSNLRSKSEPFGIEVSNTLSFASILAIPMFLGAVVLSEPVVVTIYGPEYADAAPLLVGLAAFRVFQTQRLALGQTIQGIDRPDLNVKIGAATLLLNVVLGVVLTLRIGAVGVVIATVVAEVVSYAAIGVVVRREIPEVDLVPRTVVEQLIAGGIMAVVVVGLREVVPIASWLHLLGVVSVGALVYGAILMVISSRLRLTVRRILEDAGLLSPATS